MVILKTIRAKLLGGFILLTITVIGLAAYSVIKINQSADGFSEYRQMARDVSVAGSLQANMLTTRIGVLSYLDNATPEGIDNFSKNIKTTFEDVRQAQASELSKKQQNLPNFLEQVNEIENSLKEYQAGFNEIVNLNNQYNEIFVNTLQHNGRVFEQTLTEISRSSQNPDVIQAASEALRSSLIARIYTLTYLAENTPASFTRATNELATVTEQAEILKQTMTNPDHIELLGRAETLVEGYTNGLKQIDQIFRSRNQHVTIMGQHGQKVAEITQQARLIMTGDQDRIGPIVQQLNQDIISMMTIIGILVTIFVIILAITIPRIITNGLTSIQNKLAQISQTGDFAIRADDKRQDEIGAMGQAVNQLLSNMQGAISEANAVVSALAAGQFDKRVTLSLSGDLNTLKTGINDSAENIEDVMSQLKQAMAHIRDGDFAVELTTQAQGEYRSMIETAGRAMSDMNRVIHEINAVMGKVSEGEFSERVNVSAAGDMDELKTAINATVEVLEDVIGDITQVMDAQSQGDLTLAVTTQCSGQLDQLKTSINKNAENLSNIISSALSNASIVNSASEEVSRGSLDLSQRVQEQAAALEQTSATMDQMNSAVQNNTRNSVEAAEMARGVQAKADEGTKVMAETIAAMNAIQESSHKISDIVNLIDSIAFQTNLLALNAAVEAARAGDHGRGFAVVASEVRALAQKSAEAARDIKSLIDESVTRIDQGTTLASESGEMLKGINQAIESATSMIAHISETSHEQSEGIGQVHQAIADIDQVTQQNAALVEETSAAAESLSEQAADLSRNMAFFKTGHTPKVSTKTSPKLAASKSTKASHTQPKQLVKPKAPAVKVDDSDEWSEF